MKKRFVAALFFLLSFSIIAIGQTLQFVSSTATNAIDIYVSDNYAYVTTNYNGFEIYNISQPVNPIMVSSLANCGSSNIIVQGNYAFKTDNSHIFIIDVTDICWPHIERTITTQSGTTSIFVEGNYIYYTYWQGYNRGLGIIDFNDIANPIELGNCTLNSLVERVIVIGNYAFTTGFDRLEVVDVSNKTNPIKVTETYLGIPNGIFYDGTFIYSANAHVISSPPYPTWGGMRKIDVTNPMAPIIIGAYDDHSLPIQVDIAAWPNYALLYGESGGLHLYEVSTFSNPTLIYQFNTPGTGKKMFIKDNYIYLADLNSMMVLYFSPSGITNFTDSPSSFSLSPNYPNPFNSSTTIRYNLPTESSVTIDIYDILGRKVQTLLDVKAQAGVHQVNWDADGLPSGAYFARLKAGQHSQTMKMMLMK
jgi:hypothetical protein